MSKLFFPEVTIQALVKLDIRMGEHCITKTPENIIKELTAKAAIYNMLINL